MENNLYYSGTSFVIGNKIYNTYLCAGQRGRGKTTWWLETITERAVKDILKNGDNRSKRKFFFVRREEKQLQLVFAKGLYNGVRNKSPNFMKGYVEECNGGDIYFAKDKKKIHVGYYCDLNTVKGISVEDADVMLFDEYIEPTRGKYKGGEGGIHEPEMFARLDETLFRNRENWIVMLGNNDSPTNPYNEYFGIPYGVKSWRDKKRGIFYEFDSSEAMTEFKESTSTGRRWKGTEYGDYSNGKKSLGEVSNDLICERPPQAVLLYNLKVNGTYLTVWQDTETLINYVTDDCKIDKKKPIYSVTTDDMSINTYFVSFNSSFIKINKMHYGRGLTRFNSQKTATLFMIMLSLVN